MKRSAPTGPRGGNGNRRGGKNQRTDRDGDVDMGSANGARGRIDKPYGRPNSQGSRRSPPGRSPARRNPFNDPAVQRETLRRAAAQTTSNPRSDNRSDPRPSHRSDASSNPASRPRSSFPPRSQDSNHPRPQQQPLRQARVTGWRNSTASSDKDGGVEALVGFIERRATINKNKHADNKGFNRGAPVKIRDYQVEGDDSLLIGFLQKDIAGIIHVNDCKFAGVVIQVTAIEQAMDTNTNNQTTAPAPANTPAGDSIPALNGLTPEQINLVAEVSKQTNMTPEYARMCLEQGEWNWDKAGAMFMEAKNNGSIPPEAFINNAPTAPVPAAPAVAAAPVVALTPEQEKEQKQQQLIVECARLSGLTLEYAKMCLEATNWDWEAASKRFEEIRESLPAEAWA